MKYDKPEIVVLGEASVAIMGKNGGDGDSIVLTTVAAYELDEE